MIYEEKIYNAGILIVDDNEANVRLIEKILDSAGFTSVISTTDPRQVVDLYKGFTPDLLLLDLNMPHLDGYEVMDQLKLLDPDDYLPIIVLTAQKDYETRLKSLKKGAKDFLTKPFDHLETITRIKNMLEVRLLHKEVKIQKGVLETEHLEAEEVGTSLLNSFSSKKNIEVLVEVEASSKASGDRAGFFQDWLMVFDASGHGKGASKFQEVALGAMLLSLETGHGMTDSLKNANAMIAKRNNGRFLVGNIWRVLDAGTNNDDFVLIEEINIAQHPILILEPKENVVQCWDWKSDELEGTLPIGLWDDGLDGMKVKQRKVSRGSRIITHTDGINEAQNDEGELFGEGRLKELILKTRHLSLSEAHALIVNELKKWALGKGDNPTPEEIKKVKLEDDITIALVDIQ